MRPSQVKIPFIVFVHRIYPDYCVFELCSIKDFPSSYQISFSKPCLFNKPHPHLFYKISVGLSKYEQNQLQTVLLIQIFVPRMPFISPLTLSVPETTIAEFENSIDLDEVAHNEPPHLDLHCLPSSLCILNMI